METIQDVNIVNQLDLVQIEESLLNISNKLDWIYSVGFFGVTVSFAILVIYILWSMLKKFI